jgi:SSS family transporter
VLLCLVACGRAPANDTIEWTQLPSLPDGRGFAGPFAGISDGALVVAGGANFPDAMPWQGGTKVWYDTVFVLDRPDGSWRVAGKLPRPSAYGVSITTDRGIVCVGGSDAEGHYAECFRLRLKGGAPEIDLLPALPRPTANACGALLNNTIYVAGGIEQPNVTAAFHTFWALDLERLDEGWRELPAWPGEARMLATAAAQDGAFYLIGGAALSAGSDGKPARQWLRDAYKFVPHRGWQHVAALPHPIVAAPSPAIPIGRTDLLLLGGDDGSQANDPPQAHRGFSREVLAYHAITDTWSVRGTLPFSLVTTPLVRWGERIVVPGGESRPGVRSVEVWSGRIVAARGQFGWINYATLAVYLAGMVAIGWITSRHNKTTADYFKASGRIPWWAAGLSIYATMLSSLTFMAIPAKSYATNWTYVWANMPILLLAPLVIRCYLPFFRQLEVTSAYEYLEKRFNLAARLYGSASFIVFQIGRQAIVLLLPSLAVATVSDFDVRTCIVLMGLLCVIYTVLGGIEAVIWTDVAQSFVLLGAAVVSLAYIVLHVDGGLAAVWDTAVSHGKLHWANWTLDPSAAADAFWVILLGNVFVVLIPYTSDQTVVQRYMTTHDPKQAARAIWTNALLSIPSTALFFAIGTALFVFYRSAPEALDPAVATDTIFPAFIVQNLPVGIAGLVIAGIFAAAQSTVSSSINSVATALVTDFYVRLGGTANERQRLRLARTLTAIIGLFATLAALVLAELQQRSLWDSYNSLVGLAASGLAGLFALGIFTRRAHGAGAMVGAITSAVVLYIVERHADLHFFLYAGIGVITCVAVGWLASLVLPSEAKSIEGLTVYSMSTGDSAR